MFRYAKYCAILLFNNNLKLQQLRQSIIRAILFISKTEQRIIINIQLIKRGIYSEGLLRFTLMIALTIIYN